MHGSGWAYKHPGRVGDSPIVGAGLYNDGQGAAVATGDGEEILRVSPSQLLAHIHAFSCCSHPRPALMFVMPGGSVVPRGGADAWGEVSPGGLRRGDTSAARSGMCHVIFLSLLWLRCPSLLLLRLVVATVQVAGDDAADEDEGGTGGGGQSEPRRMHARLTVGVVAMNKRGEVGAASTLGPHNVHRGRPGFPVVCWRRRGGDAEGGGKKEVEEEGGEVWRRLPNGEALHLVVAEEQGAAF